VAVDLNWELTILEIVHGFYLNLLREHLQDEITPPRGLEPESLSATQRDVAALLPGMRRWLSLLDLAISPEMLRCALTANVDHDLAESLLRYYARKQSKKDSDRDKTDFVASFLYRNPRVPGQWSERGLSMDGVAPVPPFEIALLEILDDAELPELTRDESRMLDEFEFLSDEVEQVEQFDQLMDSGILQKARRIKHSFGPAFYHPHALSVIAPYNHRFGESFVRLCTAAATHIRTFADLLQERGASLSSRVDGDITVQHLTQIEGRDILATEYRRAQEQLHNLSRLKKAVDTKAGTTRGPAGSPAAAAQRDAAQSAAGNAGPGPRSFGNPALFEEEARIRSVEGSIREWVRVADERCRHIVPMKFGNFVLAQAEADAYFAGFQNEKSFRGDNARALVRMVAVMARMQAEMEEFKHRQNSAHLWRPHAEALLLLQQAAAQASQQASATLELANQRGLVEKVKILTSTMERLRHRREEVLQTLTFAGIKSQSQQN
jgi:hypothetical protein